MRNLFKYWNTGCFLNFSLVSVKLSFTEMAPLLSQMAFQWLQMLEIIQFKFYKTIVEHSILLTTTF